MEYSPGLVTKLPKPTQQKGKDHFGSFGFLGIILWSIPFDLDGTEEYEICLLRADVLHIQVFTRISTNFNPLSELRSRLCKFNILI